VKDWRQNAYLQNLLTGSWTGTETGTGTGSCCTHRPCRQSQEIEAGISVDDLEEPPGPSQTTKKKKGDSEQGTCYYCWPSHLEGKSSNFM